MSKPSVCRSATLLLNLLVSTGERSRFDHARWRALSKARRILLRFGDPNAEYKLCGSKLLIPLSHDLPLYRRSLPLYSDNLGRIAAKLFTKYSDLSAIDIGANIGDSVAIIHHHARIPILCIEGEPKFGELLAANVAGHQPVPVIEQCFVGASEQSLVAVVHAGTARLEHAASNGGEAVRTKKLEAILEEHPAFRNARLLKIDTDGMDIPILNSALDWISRQKPVLFFEYDPDLQHACGAAGLELLAELRAVGYQRVLVYENTGDYMLSTELGDCQLLSELHEFFSGRHSIRYCDLCVFHRDDEDIAEAIRRSELEVFRRARKFTPPGTP